MKKPIAISHKRVLTTVCFISVCAIMIWFTTITSNYSITLRDYHRHSDTASSTVDKKQTESTLLPSSSYSNESSSFKYILLWNRLPGVMTSSIGNGRDALLRHGCDVTNCYVIDGLNHKKRSMDSYDAVIFNSNALYDSRVIPWTKSSFSRSQKQRFVYFTIESPIYTWGKSRKVNETEVLLYANFYNWSMSYKEDADIHLFYGSFKPKINPSSPSSTATIKKNISSSSNGAIVAWMASHCRTDSRREDYIKQLQRHIAVDTYGRCGKVRCHKQPGTAVSTEECYDVIESKYKFYLSFENSLCTDYVTEKLFRVLTRNIVPIVYGGADYSRIAPPHSYIDARQFEDAKQLADYLLVLDKNDTLYNEYFEWKDKYDVESGEELMALNGFCNLCRKLHQDKEPTSVYTKLIDDWLLKTQCSALSSSN